MVGGAPVTQAFADDMGADGYGKDAVACVDAREVAPRRRVDCPCLSRSPRPAADRRPGGDPDTAGRPGRRAGQLRSPVGDPRRDDGHGRRHLDAPLPVQGPDRPLHGQVRLPEPASADRTGRPAGLRRRRPARLSERLGDRDRRPCGLDDRGSLRHDPALGGHRADDLRLRRRPGDPDARVLRALRPLPRVRRRGEQRRRALSAPTEPEAFLRPPFRLACQAAIETANEVIEFRPLRRRLRILVEASPPDGTGRTDRPAGPRAAMAWSPTTEPHSTSIAGARSGWPSTSGRRPSSSSSSTSRPVRSSASAPSRTRKASAAAT